MIATVREIRDLLKGMSANCIVEISEHGVTQINRAHLPKRSICAADIYTLIDSGLSQVAVAEKLGTTKQVVWWCLQERKRVLNGNKGGTNG